MPSIRQFCTFTCWKYIRICMFKCWKYVSIVHFSACKNVSKCTFYRTTFYVKYIQINMRPRCKVSRGWSSGIVRCFGRFFHLVGMSLNKAWQCLFLNSLILLLWLLLFLMTILLPLCKALWITMVYEMCYINKLALQNYVRKCFYLLNFP